MNTSNQGSSWPYAIAIAVGMMGFVAIHVAHPANGQAPVDAAAKQAVREHVDLINLSHSHFCGPNPKVKTGAVYETAGGDIVAGKIDCSGEHAVATFETRINAARRTVYVAMSGDAAHERMVTLKKPTFG